MNAVATRTEITPEELIRMPDEKDFELVNGELLERNMGAMSSWIGGEIFFLIRTFLQSHALGWLFTAESGFYCFPDRPNTIRKPDVSFVRLGRLAGECPPEGYIRLAPDLIVEVISPNDLATEVGEKVVDFLNAGVPLIWVVNPHARVVHVHRADGSGSMLREHDELSGEDVLPGFRCKVSAFFPSPKPTPPATTPMS